MGDFMKTYMREFEGELLLRAVVTPDSVSFYDSEGEIFDSCVAGERRFPCDAIDPIFGTLVDDVPGGRAFYGARVEE